MNNQAFAPISPGSRLSYHAGMDVIHVPVNRIRQFSDKELHEMDALRQDHARLCGELAVLTEAEGRDSVELWQTLRDVCGRLSVGLPEHIRFEEKLLVTHGRSLGAAASEAVERLSVDHHSDYRYLQVITRHITSESRPFLLRSRFLLLTDFLRGLRDHMDRQEAELFPERI